MTPLEAMAAGTPVLLTNTCNIPKAAEAGAGVEVEPTIDGVQDGLQQLMQMSPDELRSMGERARLFVETRYRWDAICEQFEHVYGWMLGQAPMPDCLFVD